MIYSVKGTLIEKTAEEVVLETGGMGFRILVPHTTWGKAPALGGQWSLFTHMQVKEDAIELYGFDSAEARTLFRMLLTVSGIGPKVALAVLSVLSPDKVLLAIAAGDYKAFTACPGVGQKTAQRIVLDLKDKAGKLASSETPVFSAEAAGSAGKAVQALVALGYSASEAAQAVAAAPQDLSTEETIRHALRQMGGRR